MTDPVLETSVEDTAVCLRVKPVCKPDVQLKKSRQRLFNEYSIDLTFSFGYQSYFGANLSILKKNLIILISGNYLNFYNLDTDTETFLPSTFGAGFSCTSVHPSTYYFAAAEKGPKYCIHIITYPALDVCKTLRNESTIMTCCAMQFHPQGDLLITLSCDPENKVSIWHWHIEAMLYASEDSERPTCSLHFSTYDDDVFIVSGKGFVTFWSVTCTRDYREAITEIIVTQREELCIEPSKLDIYCTVSIADSFLSAITNGYLLLWNSPSSPFDDAIKIAMPEDKPCHEGCIHHIIVQENYVVTFGSDGYIKFWDFKDIANTLRNAEDEEESKIEKDDDDEDDDDDDEPNGSKDKNEENNSLIGTDVEIIYIKPVQEFLISRTAEPIYGVINIVKYDITRYLIQDRNGVLYQADIANDLSNMHLTQLLRGVGNNIVDLTSCPVYPFVAVASSFGSLIIYDCSTKEAFMSHSFFVPVTCILWPSAKVDLFASSLFIGFADGTLRWIAFTDGVENCILKFVIKPHVNGIQFLKMNDSGTILISQGLDSKLFFYSVENFSLIPLGFYINSHEVVDFAWLKYNISSSTDEYTETLLILCKYSYVIETNIPDPAQFKDSTELKETYFIENKQYQVYKINGLRQYHELGDRIYDSDCEEQSDLNEAGKEVLRKLKYEEKRERRENRRFDLGLSGPVTPSEILCCLPSAESNCIWLSMGKEDFGYIFEFAFQGQYMNEPIELIPIRALEILTVEITPVLSMQYSACGNFLFMGLQDGSLNICYLENAFEPASGYDFARYQIHDPDVGAIGHVAVSPEGSFIVTAGCDGNIFSYHFHMFDYKNIDEYGERPTLIDNNEVEDISPEKLSVEDELKKELNEKYEQMKEQRKSALETLNEDYLNLMNEFTDYSSLRDESLKELQDIPEELKINPENFSAPSVAIEMFSKKTKMLIQDIKNMFQKDLLKATLLYEKYLKCFKPRVKHDKFSVECSKEKCTLSTFRGCGFPLNIDDFQLISYPKMYKLKEFDKGFHDAKHKKEKKNKEKLKLEQELTQTCKAIIDYPSDTPVSELVSKYNQRKEEHVKYLKELIREYEIFEAISFSDKMHQETVEEIEATQFIFMESRGAEKYDFEFMSTFAEKKAKTVLHYWKAYKLWTFFNSLVYSAYEKKSHTDEIEESDFRVRENVTGGLLKKKMKHIYFERGKMQSATQNSAKVKWTYSSNEVFFDEIIAKESILKETKAEKIKKHNRIFKDFLSILLAAKPKLNCEKKFYDMRFNLKCIELNVFKTDLKAEKKWLTIVKELQDELYGENLALSAVEETKLALNSRRQLEKVEWMNIYKEFRKAIGLRHKHKGYFKKVFKKKIRPDDEKEPYKRHPSSESSESEADIDSEDDGNYNVHKKDIDQNLLREVMCFRLRRHEVEKRMKEYKRNLHANSTKEAGLHRRIQRVKDSLDEAWNELSSISVNRKVEWDCMIWPTVLYPENVHQEFFGKQISSVEENERLACKEMSIIHETITKELKPIDKLIRVALIMLTDRVINTELNDLIDIAYVFFSIVDSVSEEVDEYFKKLSSPDSFETVQKQVEMEIKPVNIIREILSSYETESNSGQTGVYSSTADISKNEEANCMGKADKFVKEDQPDEILDLEKIEISDIMTDDEKQTLKSWRDVPDDNHIPSNEKVDNQLNINSIILRSVPMLDCSLFVEENYSSSEDYYMQELYLDPNVCDQKETTGEIGLSSVDYAKMLLELDIQEVVEDILNNISEKESLNDVKKPLSVSFPTYPGGGVVLTKDVLISMENEDPDNFPYSNFYQEQVFIEELDVKTKVVHIEPCHKEVKLIYVVPVAALERFILLNKKDVLDSLKSYRHIKIMTLELEEENRLLERKMFKVKANRINVEQELLAVMRERTEEINKKFNRMVNLELLLDVIENPHLHIKKYETDLKIDSLKEDLKKLKAAEVIALKSLDKFGFEDTVICHELLNLRHEFKSLNKKYSSKFKSLPATGKNPPSSKK